MSHHYSFQSDAISAGELEMLHSTLQKWCVEKHIDIKDPRAEEAAVELIDWFQFGLKHEDQLIEMIRRT
jgi:hypothetical protein